jgi:peptidoglycan endopeptidase LytF
MRSDVKIGLAVGMLLVVVIVAYMVIGTGDKKSTPTETDTAMTDNETQRTTSLPTTVPVVTIPATNPSPLVDLTPPATQPTTNTALALGPTTSPSVPLSPSAVASASQGDYDWNNLLTGKTPPPLSATPGALPSVTSGTAKVAAGKYMVKTGDTLSSIASSQYGSVNQWKAILAANPGLKPSSLRVGQTINLPAGAKAAAPSMASGPTVTSSVPDSGKTYTVQPGDSLQKISQKLYGSTSHAKELYELNKAKIGSSPSKLRPKMVLKLPSAATKAS